MTSALGCLQRLRRFETWTRKQAALWIAAATVFAGCWFLIAPSGKGLREASFDSTYSTLQAASPPASNCPVAIVYIDLDAFLSRGLNPNRPWPRELHAQFLERLTRAGARAVAFDIVFDTADTNSASDQLLRSAIQRNGHVILPAETANSSQGTDPSHKPWTQSGKLVLPAEFFRTVAAGWGLAEVQSDQDFVVRRQFAGWPQQEDTRPSLSHALLRHIEPQSSVGLPRSSTHKSWMRYYGPPLSLPHVSMNQVLDSDTIGDDFFRNRILFVGAYPMSGKFPDRRDEFRSPFRSWRDTSLFMPGVEIHATQLLNLLQRDSLRQVPPLAELAAVVISGLVLGLGFVRLTPKSAALASFAVVALFAFSESVLFRGFNLWWAWLIPACIQTPVALGGTVFVHWIDWLQTRRRMEEAKRIADARIREQAALIEKAHDTIFVQELDGSIRYANPSAERVFGWTQDEFLRGLCSGLFESAEARAAGAIARQRGEWTGELTLRTRQGRELKLESRWNLVQHDDSKPPAILIISNDVTERRQLEAEALRAQRMEAIGALAGGMAHDLNNALAPVLLGAQLLRRELKSESSDRLLDLIETGATRGAGMVKQVLLFARGRQGHMALLSVRNLVEEMAKLAQETFPRNIHVSTQMADTLWDVHGNTTELHQVLLNLCVNARDAMPQGGSICIAVDTLELDVTEAVRFPGAQSGPYVSIMVSDTGTGIPPEVLPKIFEAFFTTKPEGRGTGLGLSTTARILRAHGGFIHVTSVVGEGTTFEVLLPKAADAQPTERSTLQRQPNVAGRGQRLLLADDDATSLELVYRGLEERGYCPIKCADGTEIAHRIQEFQDNPAQIDLVICADSMRMLDGIPAPNALRKAFPHVPMVHLTRRTASTDAMAQAASTPSNDFLEVQKPFEWDALLGALAKLLPNS